MKKMFWFRCPRHKIFFKYAPRTVDIKNSLVSSKIEEEHFYFILHTTISISKPVDTAGQLRTLSQNPILSARLKFSSNISTKTPFATAELTALHHYVSQKSEPNKTLTRNARTTIQVGILNVKNVDEESRKKCSEK